MRLNHIPPKRKFIKMLLVGPSKTGKTFYASQAAEDGFHLCYLDGDVGVQTLSLASPAAQSRIHLLDMRDQVGGGRRSPDFVDAMIKFTTEAKFTWNEDTQRPASIRDAKGLRSIIYPARMDENVILVIDSWTGLSESAMLRAAIDHSVDLNTATTIQLRPVYQAAGIKLTQFLAMLRSAPCHVLVIAHPDEYVQTKKPDGAKMGKIPEADLEIIATKMIPKSSSKPNGLSMGKYFTDVAWLELNGSGTGRLLNFRQDNDKVSGGHFTDMKSVNDYSFANLVKLIGGAAPTGDAPTDHWIQEIDTSIESPADAASPAPAAPVLDSSKPSGPVGFAALMNKKG